MSNTAPKTYSEAIKVAEPVSVEEFDALITESKGSVTLFERHTPRRHCYLVRWLVPANKKCVWVNCAAPRSGYDTGHSAFLSQWRPPVFDFYNLGRIVRVVREDVAS